MDFSLDVNKAMEELAKAFNTTVEFLHPILVTQAKIEAYTKIGWLSVATLVFIISLFFVIRNGRKIYGNQEYTDFDDILLFVTIITGAISGLVLLFGGVGAIKDILTAYFNPEYFVLKEIFETLKGS